MKKEKTKKIYDIRKCTVLSVGNAVGEGKTTSRLVNLHGVFQTADLKQLDGSEVLGGTNDTLSLEKSQGLLDGSVGGGNASKGEDHNTEAHLAGFVDSHGRAGAVLNTVEQQGPGSEVLDGLGSLLLALEALEQTDIGTEITGGAETLDALVVAKRLEGVGAGNQNKVGAHADAGGVGSADAGVVLLTGDDLLAREMAAALGQDLVLKMGTSDTGTDILFDGTGSHDGACILVSVCHECLGKDEYIPP